LAVPAAGFVALASASCLPAATAKPVVVWGPNLRMVLPAVLLLLPLLRNSLRGKQALLLVPLLAMVLFHGVQINIRFVRFDRIARHIEPLLAATKTNRRLLPLSLGAQDYQHNGGALAFRAKVVLRCSEGLKDKTVAKQLRTTPHTVGKWRNRFVYKRVEGLLDEPTANNHR
jgi:hypothetical protein